MGRPGGGGEFDSEGTASSLGPNHERLCHISGARKGMSGWNILRKVAQVGSEVGERGGFGSGRVACC